MADWNYWKMELSHFFPSALLFFNFFCCFNVKPTLHCTSKEVFVFPLQESTYLNLNTFQKRFHLLLFFYLKENGKGQYFFYFFIFNLFSQQYDIKNQNNLLYSLTHICLHTTCSCSTVNMQKKPNTNCHSKGLTSAIKNDCIQNSNGPRGPHFLCVLGGLTSELTFQFCLHLSI